MINLLKETEEALKHGGKSPADVLWVGARTAKWGGEGSRVGSFSWQEFALLADFSYDNGYGDNNIAGSLVVVGSDWWLERGEYNGSEWWEFKTLPVRPATIEPVRTDLMAL